MNKRKINIFTRSERMNFSSEDYGETKVTGQQRHISSIVSSVTLQVINVLHDRRNNLNRLPCMRTPST